MTGQHKRRSFIKSAVFGVIGIAGVGNIAAMPAMTRKVTRKKDGDLFYRYPALDDDRVSAVVGASHSNYDKVKELVTKRPELACASWDWGFGDAETALGAASHVGRKDIAELLIRYGARPDIFTLTMFGAYEAVKHAVEAMPGIQRIPGPHGITLLQHARNRLSNTDITTADKLNVEKLLRYLESLGDADNKAKSLAMTEQEKEQYFGEYRFGEKENDLFIVNTNSRKLLQISRKGYAGRILHKTDEHIFSPSGSPSVSVIFTVQDHKAIAVTIHEPEPLIKGIKI